MAQDLKIGDVVCVPADQLDSFLVREQRKLRNREGVVTRFQQYSGKPIVVFPKVRNRPSYSWVVPNFTKLHVVRHADKEQS